MRTVQNDTINRTSKNDKNHQYYESRACWVKIKMIGTDDAVLYTEYNSNDDDSALTDCQQYSVSYSNKSNGVNVPIQIRVTGLT